MKRQTHAIDRIVVIDYPQKTFPYDLTERYRAGFAQLTDMDLVFCIEDDDFYASDYIETMVREWERNGRPDIIGFDSTIYYHIYAQKYAIMEHEGRASAFCTAIRPAALDEIVWEAIDPLWFDIGIWQQIQSKAAIKIPAPVAMGIKHGLGDTPGAGHKAGFYRGVREIQDFGMRFFRSYVHGDFGFYAEIIGKRAP